MAVRKRLIVLMALVWAAESSELTRADFDKPRPIETVAPETKSSALSVTTWNIDRGVHLETVASELAEHPADLLLLQEVDWNTARAGHLDVASELAHRLRLNGSYAVEFEELSQERNGQAFIGQATLTRLPIRRSRVLRFRFQSGFWKPRSWMPSSLPLMQRRLGNRVALVTELTFAGKLLVVYNAHLESRSYGRIQAHQLDEMLADARTYPAGTAVILGGDLNTKYLPSFFLKKLERAGFHSVLGEKVVRTHAIAMSLDWIFVNETMQTSGGQVHKEFKGSDHYPVCASIRVR